MPLARARPARVHSVQVDPFRCRGCGALVIEGEGQLLAPP